MSRVKLKLNSRRKSIGIRCVGLLVVALFWLVTITIWAAIGFSEEKGKNERNKNFIGKFGAMMVEMLPEDVPFTVFVPTERAFKRHLGLHSNATVTEDVSAIVSRVVGFSTIPRALRSSDVALDGLSSYDSVSGFGLYVSKDRHGMLVVNGIRSERVDLRTQQVIVHLMDGVIMDAQFQESI